MPCHLVSRQPFAAWRRFFEELAELQPLVLVFEDLHWADDGLLDFADYLAGWAGGVPLLVVGTARPELLARRPGWGDGKPNAVTLSLAPLSEQDTARLIGSLLGRPVLEAGQQAALLARVGGRVIVAGCHSQAAYRVLNGDRHEEGEPVSSDLAAARGAKTILLTTYKRDGTPVPTPVSIAFDGDRAFFRSYDKAGKTKRLRNNPRVEFAASTLRGKPTGPPVRARAILLEGDQARIAAKAMARHHRVLQGIVVPLAHRLMHYQTMHYELMPGPGQGFPEANAT